MKEARELVHGTCVALGPQGVLLRGGSGSGKSDLALRFLALTCERELEPRLVADDQVFVHASENGELIASAPARLGGKLEVRGVGILDVPHLAQARVLLAVDLVNAEEVPRLPPDPLPSATIAGVAVPLLKLAPFEASAPFKLKLALLSALSQGPLLRP